MKKVHVLFLLWAVIPFLGIQQAQGNGTDNAVDDFLDSLLTPQQKSTPAAPSTQAKQGNKSAADTQRIPPPANNNSQTGILNNQTARMWAERIWSNYTNNDISYMWNWYESTVHLPKNGTYMSLNELMDSQRKYLINRWVYRTCQPLDFAWGGNRVEVRFRYTCSNNAGKTVRGYCKNTLFISPNGRIQGFMDDSSSKKAPDFSPGLQIGH